LSTSAVPAEPPVHKKTATARQLKGNSDTQSVTAAQKERRKSRSNNKARRLQSSKSRSKRPQRV
jgi:hypothetical protein